MMLTALENPNTRTVHWPVDFTDVYSIVTPRKVFDYTRSYRVLYLPSGDDEDDDNIKDVFAPTTHYSRKQQKIITRDLSLCFHRGAEEDLDRYLRWLNKSVLINEFGTPERMVVLEDDTHTMQKVMETTYGTGVRFLAPGDLQGYGLMSVENHKGLYLF